MYHYQLIKALYGINGRSDVYNCQRQTNISDHQKRNKMINSEQLSVVLVIYKRVWESL